jgi:hypothetical protein
MEAQIIFAGLCSFLNLDKHNETMPEPSVIMVRTDHHDHPLPPALRTPQLPDAPKEPDPPAASPQPEHGADVRSHWHIDSVAHIDSVEISSTVKIAFTSHDKSGDPAINVMNAPQQTPAVESPVKTMAEMPAAEPITHIAFIAFDMHQVAVSDVTKFKAVPGAPTFLYCPLDGVELKVDGDPGGELEINPNYADVVRKDDFWPAARDQWNRAFVPEPGLHQPKKDAVVAFMRFGSGTIERGNLTSQEWQFPINNDAARFGVHKGRFAREVIYGRVPTVENGVNVILSDVETGEEQGRLRFTLLTPSDDGKLTLFVGNNTEKDIANVVNRIQPQNAARGTHFLFLNRIAHPSFGEGPVPEPIVVEGLAGLAGELPGSGTDGYCGPDTGNGKKG